MRNTEEPVVVVVAAQIFNSSTHEAETGRGQPDLHN